MLIHAFAGDVLGPDAARRAAGVAWRRLLLERRVAGVGGAMMTSGAARRRTGTGFDVRAIREDFPILRQTVHGKPLVYLDNAATTQKPQAVIDRRGAATTCRRTRTSTAACTCSASAPPTRTRRHAQTVQRFLNAARSAAKIVFVRGTTEAINLVAQTYGRIARRARRRGSGDLDMEHHSNIVPVADAVRGEGRAAARRPDRPTTASCGWTSTSAC